MDRLSRRFLAHPAPVVYDRESCGENGEQTRTPAKGRVLHWLQLDLLCCFVLRSSGFDQSDELSTATGESALEVGHQFLDLDTVRWDSILDLLKGREVQCGC